MPSLLLHMSLCLNKKRKKKYSFFAILMQGHVTRLRHAMIAILVKKTRTIQIGYSRSFIDSEGSKAMKTASSKSVNGDVAKLYICALCLA